MFAVGRNRGYGRRGTMLCLEKFLNKRVESLKPVPEVQIVSQ
jgi:hypothetical protein